MIMLVLVWVCLWLGNTKLIQERIDKISSYKGNYLLRGNLPIHDNKFQMEELCMVIDQMTATQDHDVVVVSLLNFFTAKETRSRYIEEKFFEAHQQINQHSLRYVNHYVLGDLWGPHQVPSFLGSLYLQYYDWISFDRLNTLLSKLHSLLHSSQPTHIYVHCSAGVDRTGYVGGAYKMKYLNKSLTEVLQENLLILSGYRNFMHFNTFNGLQWFCLSLGRSSQECLVGVARQELEELGGDL